MVSLLIRNVDAALHAELKTRAALHRRSMEDEARLLLKAALAEPSAAENSIVAIAAQLFGPYHGTELDVPPRTTDGERPPPDFNRMILLDTNVISELMRPEPDPRVTRYVAAQRDEALCTSAICEAELRYGLARLPPGARRDDLSGRVSLFLQRAFPGRILPFTTTSTPFLAEIRATRDAIGRPVSLADALIAATARAHGARIATRDTAGFADTGADLVNPWNAYP